MRRSLLTFILILILLPSTFAAMQDVRSPRLEITGLNPTELPTVRVSVNVFDAIGQPVAELTAEDFVVTGELADRARIVQVRSFADQAIPINIVLVVDVSSSMAGSPIESAKLAANTFVNAIGPNDPVSIVAFSTGSRIVQEYTTDVSALESAINGLVFGGQTFLYDGTLAAIEQAIASDNPRRAVILLSDGAQYDTTGSSDFTAEEAINRAVANGVPVYAIGLGFGVDRSFLQNLAGETNGVFRESPTPAELQAIYQELADLLRTQYEVVLEVDVPLDGTTYDLVLEVNTPEGTAQASGRLRAPVPVPVIRLPELPDVIDTVIEAEAEIIADDALTGVEIALDGTAQPILTEPPFSITLDPMLLAPGPHSLAFTATDEDGDVSANSIDFVVAALPSDVVVVPALDGEISEIETFTLDISGQTATAAVNFSLDGGEAALLEAPYLFTIDPFNLAPGEHLVGITVTNEGGVTTGIGGLFTVPELPAQISINGLGSGEVLSGTAEVSVDVTSSQAPVTAITFDLNGETIDTGGANSLVLDAASLRPGASQLVVTVTDELGQATTAALNFEVAALPPVINISGLELGEELDADRTVEILVDSQTPVTAIDARIDGSSIPVSESDPAAVLLEVLALEPGVHILGITVTNESGQSAQIETAFNVAEGPSLTATALVPPSATPTTEAAPTDAASATPTSDTQAVEPTATTEAPTEVASVPDSGATSTEQAGEAPATAETATVDGSQLTADAQATADLVGTANAQATGDAQATIDAQAVVEATATEAAPAESATPTLSAEDLDATLDAVSAGAISGLFDLITATASARETQNAPTPEPTVDLNAQATADALLTATQLVVEVSGTETSEAEVQAANVLATENAAGTETQTANEQAAVNALATENAAGTETQTANEQATSDALATENAAGTETQTANEQATSDALATENAAGTETQVAGDEATSAAEVTEEVTEEAADVTPTEAGTAVAQEVTEVSATPMTGGESGSPVPTITPIGTLIPAQAESTPSSEALTPVVIIIVIIVVVLLVLYLALSSARRRQRR